MESQMISQDSSTHKLLVALNTWELQILLGQISVKKLLVVLVNCFHVSLHVRIMFEVDIAKFAVNIRRAPSHYLFLHCFDLFNTC